MNNSSIYNEDSLKIQNLIDNAQRYEAVRKLRWPNGKAECPFCDSSSIICHGHDDTEPERQKYKCKTCDRYFDDLTGTIFAGHHQPLKVWIVCLYFMGLNLSNRQIAQELDLNESDVQQMTDTLRGGITIKKPKAKLEGEAEIDEVYIVAGHKGHPEVVQKEGREGRRNRLKGARGRGTLEKEKPPVLGLIQRGGEVSVTMLENVKQETIAPIIRDTIIVGNTIVYTDEYSIYDRLPEWGYEHKSVCHARGEYARDEDGDGFHEVHVNTIEGFWSLLRSWLRPHRGISQEKLPYYLGFFEFVHNVKRRGKALLASLINLLVY
jgi:transposase-like protein